MTVKVTFIINDRDNGQNVSFKVIKSEASLSERMLASLITNVMHVIIKLLSTKHEDVKVTGDNA